VFVLHFIALPFIASENEISPDKTACNKKHMASLKSLKALSEKFEFHFYPQVLLKMFF